MASNTMIVSDIDDTIKWSHIRGLPFEVARDGLDYRLAFKGMPELYTSLADAGARFSYVTGAPDIIIDHLQADLIPHKVISTNHFPNGDICLRGKGESTEDFKIAKITTIMRENADFDFMLIGDNGERDVETYTRLRQDKEIGVRVKHIFIHTIYHGGRSLDPMPDQRPFVTAAELAAMLYGLGFLNAGDLTAVVKIVDEGMNDKAHDHNLTVPFAAQLLPVRVDAIYKSLPPTIDSPTQKLLDDIHNLILEQARQGPRPF